MHLIAIGWLYVVVMMAIVSDSILKGVVRLLFLGVLPVALWLWITVRRHRSRMARAAEAEAANQATPPDNAQ
jgi:type VI protein secretion system component VasK